VEFFRERMGGHEQLSSPKIQLAGFPWLFKRHALCRKLNYPVRTLSFPTLKRLVSRLNTLIYGGIVQGYANSWLVAYFKVAVFE